MFYMVFLFSKILKVRGGYEMKSWSDKVNEYAKEHRSLLKIKPTNVPTSTMTHAIYDNSTHKIIGLVNISSEQACELNNCFKHEGVYKMRYVALQIT